MLDGAPHAGFIGDQDRIGRHGCLAGCQCFDMPGPVSRVVEDTLLMGGKAVDQVLRQVAPLHVCEGSVVDDPQRSVSKKTVQKAQPRLGRASAEGGEAGGADLRGIAIPACVARTRVIHRDIGAGETGFQHRLVFRPECRELRREEANDLPLRDDHAHVVEKRGDALAGDLSAGMKREHQAMNLWTVTADDAGREFRDDVLTRRCLPPLAAVARHRRLQVKVLDHDVFIAFVP